MSSIFASILMRPVDPSPAVRVPRNRLIGTYCPPRCGAWPPVSLSTAGCPHHSRAWGLTCSTVRTGYRPLHDVPSTSLRQPSLQESPLRSPRKKHPTSLRQSRRLFPPACLFHALDPLIRPSRISVATFGRPVYRSIQPPISNISEPDSFCSPPLDISSTRCWRLFSFLLLVFLISFGVPSKSCVRRPRGPLKNPLGEYTSAAA